MTAGQLATWIAILLGSGGIGSGAFRLAAAGYRQARAAETLRDAIVALLENHEDRIRVLEQAAATPKETPAWPPTPTPRTPPSAAASASRSPVS